MFTLNKLFNLMKVYLLPNTKQETGYKIAVWGGVFAAGWLWIISLLSFFSVEMPSRDLEGFLFLMTSFGYGFYVFISAFYWMILTFMFHDFPKLSGILGMVYVILAILYADIFPGNGLYFPINNTFLLPILILLLINPILADKKPLDIDTTVSKVDE